MQTSGTLQEFIELITAEVRELPEAQKAEFRAGWLAAYDRTALRLTGNDVKWLREIKIVSVRTWPSGRSVGRDA